MGSYNHKISDQSKVKFNPVSRELENTESALPSVTSSDNGKVLTVNSSGEWVADAPSEELPTVTSSDQGKVLTVNSSGEWVADEPSEELPSVTSSDEGKVLTVDSSGEWVADNPSELPNEILTDFSNNVSSGFVNICRVGNLVIGTIQNWDGQSGTQSGYLIQDLPKMAVVPTSGVPLSFDIVKQNDGEPVGLLWVIQQGSEGVISGTKLNYAGGLPTSSKYRVNFWYFCED